MHARIGTFEVPIDRMDAMVSLFRDRVVPSFERCAGFLGYEAYVDRESGRFVGLSFWESLDALQASDTAARSALAEAAALGAAVLGSPQITELAFGTRRVSSGP